MPLRSVGACTAGSLRTASTIPGNRRGLLEQRASLDLSLNVKDPRAIGASRALTSRRASRRAIATTSKIVRSDIEPVVFAIAAAFRPE